MSDLIYFAARFDSECDQCSGEIWQGDRIARTPDADYICEDCAEETEAEQDDGEGSLLDTL